MSADPDDESLTWAGDEVRVTPGAVPDAPKPGADESDAVAERQPVPAVLLVTYGVLAGIYLIYAVGWAVAMQRNTIVQPDALSEFMFTLGEALAIASPALWFAAVVVLTRGGKPLGRLLALLAGLAVVIPWPFVLGV
jgi:hypothetical protein